MRNLQVENQDTEQSVNTFEHIVIVDCLNLSIGELLPWKKRNDYKQHTSLIDNHINNVCSHKWDKMLLFSKFVSRWLTLMQYTQELCYFECFWCIKNYQELFLHFFKIWYPNINLSLKVCIVRGVDRSFLEGGSKSSKISATMVGRQREFWDAERLNR